MPFDILLNLLSIAALASFTPGPNNILLAASGANFGFRRTLPHIMGITYGFPIMILIVGLLLGELFQQSAVLREALRWMGAALLLYLAYQVATSGAIGAIKGEPRPFTAVEAAAFQWVNPKSWAMAIAVSAQFIDPDHVALTAMIISLAFAVIAIGATTTWALIGTSIHRFLKNDIRRRVFNGVMGGLLALFVVLLLAD
jgi:threonine/homoserine/homoserine lactone efflux protein